MDTNVLLDFNKEQKCSNLTKITMITFIFYFYPLFDAQFVENRKQLALVYAV